MSTVKLKLDLTTPQGRAAMRAYLDAFEPGPARWPDLGIRSPSIMDVWAPNGGASAAAGPLPKVTGGEQPAGEGTREPPPAAVVVAAGSAAAGGDARQAPAPGPLPPAEDDIETADPGPVPIEEPEPEGSGRLDPERPWDAALKRAAWDLHLAGLVPGEIADRLSLRRGRVASYISNVKNGAMRPPPPSVGALAVVAPDGGALAVADRRNPAQDPAMQAERREALAEAERMKFVARSVHPEMRP